MPDYRRNRVPGGTFFFTVNLLDRRSNLLVRHIDALRAAVRPVRAGAPFDIDARVVLPDHMHCLWTLPQGDANFSGRWRAVKITFAKSLPAVEPRSEVMTRRGERSIWRRAIGSIRSAMTATLPFISITSTSTRSSTVSSATRRIGGIRRFAAAWPTGFTQPAGLTAVPNRRKPASGNQSALQRARPTASVVGGMRCAIPPYAYSSSSRDVCMR